MQSHGDGCIGKTNIKNLNEVYLAFDILPMASPGRIEGVRIATVIKLQDGDQIEWPNINRNKLIRIINKYNPHFVGTDNPNEILKPHESIRNFCSKLPPVSNFVHVNRLSNGKFAAILDLLKEHNLIENKIKLSPLTTAAKLINLMEIGVGMIIEPFENETLIDIARPRRRGKGGWSQSRYERQGEEIVWRATNELKLILDTNDLDYDIVARETKYGAKQSRFHLFESREVVLACVKISSLYPAKVKVWSPKKSVASYRSIKQRLNTIETHIYNGHQRLLVGIDPGITTGVAIVSLSGEIMSVYSGKNLSRGNIIANLALHGSPVAICADVSPPPHLVSKIASTYNAKLFYPKNQLSQFEKRELVRKYSPNNKYNSHERDALAAVLHTLGRVSQSFQKIEKKDFTISEIDMAKALIVRGLSVMDASAAIEIVRKPNENKEKFVSSQAENKENVVGRLYNLLGDMARSEEIISNLRSHGSNLENKIQDQNYKLKQFTKRLTKGVDRATLNILRSEIIGQKENQIKHLTKRFQAELKTNQILIDRIRDLEKLLWSTIDRDNLPIKVLPRFSKDSIYKLEEEMNVQDNDILLILNPTGGSHQTARNLSKTKFKLIFIEKNKMPDEAFKVFEEERIPILYSKDYKIHRINQYAMISVKEFTRALEFYKEELIMRRYQRRTKIIDLTIENYQFEREKLLLDTLTNYDNYEPEEDNTAK